MRILSLLPLVALTACLDPFTQAVPYTVTVPAYLDVNPAFGTAEDLDTLDLDGHRMRMTGMDNVEMSDSDAQAALLELERFLSSENAICTIVDDTRVRLRGSCTIGGVDVAGWLIARGYAVAE